MKRINGSWLEIHHFNEAEGKYFNPICHEFSDIQWKEKVKEMDKLILEVEKSLKKAPGGSLVLSKSNGVTQYYHKTEHTQKKGKYISSKNKKIIAALAQKMKKRKLNHNRIQLFLLKNHRQNISFLKMDIRLIML